MDDVIQYLTELMNDSKKYCELFHNEYFRGIARGLEIALEHINDALEDKT